jgi:hypothetical protein
LATVGFCSIEHATTTGNGRTWRTQSYEGRDLSSQAVGKTLRMAGCGPMREAETACSSPAAYGEGPKPLARPAPYYPHGALPPVSRGSLHSAFFDACHRACGNVWAWSASKNAKELASDLWGKNERQVTSGSAVGRKVAGLAFLGHSGHSGRAHVVSRRMRNGVRIRPSASAKAVSQALLVRNSCGRSRAYGRVSSVHSSSVCGYAPRLHYFRI